MAAADWSGVLTWVPYEPPEDFIVVGSGAIDRELARAEQKSAPPVERERQTGIEARVHLLLEDGRARTQREIASLLGVTYQQVNQALARLVDKWIAVRLGKAGHERAGNVQCRYYRIRGEA